MKAIPAIDLRGGCAVQLVGGVPGSERVALEDPVSVAKTWVATGFRTLHIVDLDAALGDGDNRAIALRIVREGGADCQMGGGIRDDATLDALAAEVRIVTGTRAVEDGHWLHEAASRWPGRIIVAADVREGCIVSHGWTRATRIDAGAFIGEIDTLPLGGVMVTDVSREGRMQGADIPLFARLAAATRLPLQAAGGIAAVDDLRRLREAGVAAAVLGMSLYTGQLDAAAIAREFDE